MLPKPTNTTKDKKEAEYRYEGAEAAAITEGVKAFFEGRKYKLESGTPESGVYGIGSDILRILFGAFAKRYKFSVNISTDGGVVVLRFAKAMSGAMGGLIGHSKMNTEFNTIAGAFEQGVG